MNKNRADRLWSVLINRLAGTTTETFVIADNISTYKQYIVRTWLVRHKRFCLDFIQASR